MSSRRSAPPRDHSQSTPEVPLATGETRDSLVTVESQREFDLFSGEWAERVFVKLYVAARTSGLLAAMSDRDWKTLCTLATYMDGDGYCYPSQSELAQSIGCSRQMANERVQHLAAFRFQDQPVVIIVKNDRHQTGTWARNGYRVLSISNLRIYGDQSERNDSSNDSEIESGSTVSRKLDTVGVNAATMSSQTVTVGLDTNKKHVNQQEFEYVSKFRKSTQQVRENQERIGGEGIRMLGRQSSTVDTMTLEVAIDNLKRKHDAESSKASGGSVRRSGLPRRRRQQEPEYQVIQAMMRDIGVEFHDRASLSSTTSRAFNVWRRSGMELDTFVEQLYAARTIVKERTGAIRSSGQPNGAGFPVKHGMGYFFAVLNDLTSVGAEDDEKDEMLVSEHTQR